MNDEHIIADKEAIEAVLSGVYARIRRNKQEWPELLCGYCDGSGEHWYFAEESLRISPCLDCHGTGSY